MRLIDADALIEGRVENDPVVIHVKCAPTVDQERHGRWIETKDGLDNIKCSICGTEWNMIDNDTHTFDYCPNCGSKMDLE